jgi:hypothetical protein
VKPRGPGPRDIDRIDELTDLQTDLARRHRATGSVGIHADRGLVDADFAALQRDGYVILEGLLSPRECAQLRAAVTPLLDKAGRNTFEGVRTQRVYSVLNKTRACDRLVDHPRVLALLDRLLLPNYLLSQLQVINILPGEAAQLLHPDDAIYPVPRPRPPLSAATVWAIDAFTADNGATVVLPGSHLWDAGRTPSAAGRGHAGWFVRVLPRHALARRRGQPRGPFAPCRHCPVLRTMATTTRGVHALRRPRRCEHGVSGHPAHARLQHSPAVPRDGQRHAPQAPADTTRQSLSRPARKGIS